VQESYDLGNEFTKTFASSYKIIRETQEVEGKQKEKEKGISLTAIKKLIKLLNSPAAAPKT